MAEPTTQTWTLGRSSLSVPHPSVVLCFPVPRHHHVVAALRGLGSLRVNVPHFPWRPTERRIFSALGSPCRCLLQTSVSTATTSERVNIRLFGSKEVEKVETLVFARLCYA